MADRGAVPFGTTRHKAARFVTLPAMLKLALRSNTQAALSFNQHIAPLIKDDANLAFDMYAGRFEFAGQTIAAPPSEIFTRSRSIPPLQEALNNLDWLKHFNASQRSLHDQYAMRLLRYWSKQPNHKRSGATQVKIICTLATHGQDIARRCDRDIQSQFLELAATEIKALTKIRPRNAEEAVTKALALFYGLTSFHGLEYLLESAHKLLDQNIDHVILADGGHVSRQMQKLIAFLELALPLQHCKKPLVPNSLVRATENGLALLNLLQTGDGGIAPVVEDDIDQKYLHLLTAFHQHNIPAQNMAPHSGFARIDQNGATLIANTSSGLAIAFSDGQERLFHTHLSSTGEAAPAKLISAPQGTALTMQTAQAMRTCFLSENGSDLRIEDAFANPISPDVIIHVASGVKLSSLLEGQAILLVTAAQCVWHLKLRGGFAHIRQSAMRSEIVITPDRTKSPGCINWSLKKQPKPSKPTRKKSNPEPDLLG